jgi:hypothetical protein
MDSNRPVRLIITSPLILAGQFISRRKETAAAAEDSCNERGAAASSVARQSLQSAAFNVTLKRSSRRARRRAGNFAPRGFTPPAEIPASRLALTPTMTPRLEDTCFRSTERFPRAPPNLRSRPDYQSDTN